MNRNIINLPLCIITLIALLLFIVPAQANDTTVFEMPRFDIEKTYKYNTMFDIFIPARNGKEAVLYWGEKNTIDGKEYYIFNLSKMGGGEEQYIGVDTENEFTELKRIRDLYSPITFMNLTYDPATLLIDYPLWVEKTWDRESVHFSGSVWMGNPVNIEGITMGSAKVVSEEDVAVPAGVVHTLVLETPTTSKTIINGHEIWMNNSQKIWLMENGFFAKRQLFHGGRLEEELELKSPVLAKVDIKPETLIIKSKGILTALIELPEHYNIADIDINTVVCEGAPAVEEYIENGKLIVKFQRMDLRKDLPTDKPILLTINGKLNDGTPFEGFDSVMVK